MSGPFSKKLKYVSLIIDNKIRIYFTPEPDDTVRIDFTEIGADIIDIRTIDLQESPEDLEDRDLYLSIFGALANAPGTCEAFEYIATCFFNAGRQSVASNKTK